MTENASSFFSARCFKKSGGKGKLTKLLKIQGFRIIYAPAPGVTHNHLPALHMKGAL